MELLYIANMLILAEWVVSLR